VVVGARASPTTRCRIHRAPPARYRLPVSKPRIQTFEEFWPYYLGEHRNAVCRLLHFAGSTLALLIVVAAALSAQPWLLVVAVVSGYAFAWVGHFFVEKNRPASFKYPLWSFAADWKMWSMILIGRLDAELSRLGLVSPAR
jgi:hypothetical protein